MSNAFMDSAKKSKNEQKVITESAPKVDKTEDELKIINVRISSELHRKASLHRIDTGENMTQLVNRLLQAELGGK